MSVRKMRLLTLAVVCAAAGLSQNQDQKEPPTVRDYCVKVDAGKSAEFETFAHDYALPLSQARAASGEFSWFLIMRAVVPAGTSANCDYRVVYGYRGLPPETASSEQIEAAIRQAKLKTTAKEMIARRDSMSHLVDVGIWVQLASSGGQAQKGGYVRLNHYNVKPRAFDEWVRLETTYWKPIVESWTKTGATVGWGAYNLLMPQGENQPYNAVTVDIFPDWKALVNDVPLNELWPKTHPHTEATEVFDRLDGVRSRHDIEIYKVLEMVAPTS